MALALAALFAVGHAGRWLGSGLGFALIHGNRTEVIAYQHSGGLWLDS